MFNKVRTKKFANLMKDVKPQLQETLSIPSKEI